MSRIDLLKFDVEKYKLNSSSESEKVFYINDYDDLLINYFDSKPDISAKNDTETEIRNSYRNLAINSGGAIIEVSKIRISFYVVIKTIFKFRLSPSGIVYIGSYTIPFENFSYVIKFQCPEIGTAGIRDTTIFELMLKKGIVKFSENKKVLGWMQDPYIKELELPFMMNLSEKEEFDDLFPEHPLTRLRQHMKNFERTIKIDESLKNESPFLFGKKL